MKHRYWRYPVPLNGKLTLSVCLAIALAGCSTPAPMSFTIEQLAVEDTSREGDVEDRHYRTNIAIHGLGTPKTVGTLVTVPKQKTSNSIFGKSKGFPDFLATPVTTNQSSRILVQTFDTDSAFNMRDYLNGMDKLVALYAELSVLEGKQLLLQSGAAYAEDLPPNQRLSNADTLTPQLRTALGMQKFSTADIATRKTELASQSEATLKAIREQETQLEKLADQQNVWVWRWSANQESNLGGGLGTIGSASAANHKAQDGYLIVAGMRIATLEIGQDFQDFQAKRPSEEFGIPYLVTQQFSAKELAFREDVDIEKALAMDTSLNLTALGTQFNTALQQQQAKIALSLRRSLLSGVHGRTQRSSFKPMEFKGFSNPLGHDDTELEDAKHYTPFYTVRVEMCKLTAQDCAK